MVGSRFGWMAEREVYKMCVVLVGASQVLLAPSSAKLVHQQPSWGRSLQKLAPLTSFPPPDDVKPNFAWVYFSAAMAPSVPHFMCAAHQITPFILAPDCSLPPRCTTFWLLRRFWSWSDISARLQLFAFSAFLSVGNSANDLRIR